MGSFNRALLRDKILGCWAGKNIGGTLGTPFEKMLGPHNVSFYTHKLDGQPLPNDDLDLQLVWLAGLEKYFTPYGLTPQIMGELWHNFIIGHWNEYGVCNANIGHGFYPPLSGKINNQCWQWSNGAWIRSEIWACCFPGSPDEAIRAAWLDACCDHNGEGIYAEMFTAALESAAFVEEDIHLLIEIALARIPADSRVSRAVRLAQKFHADGKTWLEARNALLEDSQDLGTFQAPCNVGFAVVGLLWGEGDIGKTVCIAVNCGDDTDCTAGTAGSVIGIIQGFSRLPEEWLKPIGMSIQTCCITHLGDVWPVYPKDVEELTDRVLNVAVNTAVYNPELPRIVKEGGEFTPEERAALRTPAAPDHTLTHPTVAELLWAKPSTELEFERAWAKIFVRYPDDPEVVPGQPFQLQLRFRDLTSRITDLRVKLRLPENWVSPNNDQAVSLVQFLSGETLSFELVAPAEAGVFSTVELEIWRNGVSCPEIIALPMQTKGRFSSKMVLTPPDALDEWRLRSERARRTLA